MYQTWQIQIIVSHYAILYFYSNERIQIYCTPGQTIANTIIRYGFIDFRGEIKVLTHKKNLTIRFVQRICICITICSNLKIIYICSCVSIQRLHPSKNAFGQLKCSLKCSLEMHPLFYQAMNGTFATQTKIHCTLVTIRFFQRECQITSLNANKQLYQYYANIGFQHSGISYDTKHLKLV